VKYHAIENPTLLTLVNPGKPKSKTSSAKTGGSKVGTAKRDSKGRFVKGSKTTSAKKTTTKGKSKGKSKSKSKLSAAQLRAVRLANLEKARKARQEKSAARERARRASVSKGSYPKKRPSKHARQLESLRKARSKVAKEAGIEYAGWYPRGAVREKAEWVWVGNKSRGRKKAAPKRRSRSRKVSRKRTTRRNPMPTRSKRTGRFLKGKASTRRNPSRRKSTRRRSTRRKPARRMSAGRRFRRNAEGVLGTLKGMVLPFLAGGIGFFGARAAGNQIMRIEQIPPSMRPYAPAAANLLTALAAYYLPKKVKALETLAPYSEPMMVGALVGLAETLITQYAPPNVQAYVAPPTALTGLGRGLGANLDVYERALSGGVSGALAADDGIGGYLGEYIQTPGMGEYIQTPGMGEYIETPGMGAWVEEDFAGYSVSADEGLAEYIETPGMGAWVEEDFAGVGYDITADEGLADNGMSIYGNETNGGILGPKAGQGNGALNAAINEAANQAAAVNGNMNGAAVQAYRTVKNRMGLSKGTPQLRAAVIAAVNRVFMGQGGGYQAMDLLNRPQTNPLNPVVPIGSSPSIYNPPTPVVDKYAAASAGMLTGSVFTG
jgi:hypothetical protein